MRDYMVTRLTDPLVPGGSIYIGVYLYASEKAIYQNPELSVKDVAGWYEFPRACHRVQASGESTLQ